MRNENCLSDYVEAINHWVMHIENHVKPQNRTRRGERCEGAAVDFCHRLRGIAIDLPDEVWARIVSSERIDELANCGLRHAVSIKLFLSRQSQK